MICCFLPACQCFTHDAPCLERAPHHVVQTQAARWRLARMRILTILFPTRVFHRDPPFTNSTCGLSNRHQVQLHFAFPVLIARPVFLSTFFTTDPTVQLLWDDAAPGGWLDRLVKTWICLQQLPWWGCANVPPGSSLPSRSRLLQACRSNLVVEENYILFWLHDVAQAWSRIEGSQELPPLLWQNVTDKESQDTATVHF